MGGESTGQCALRPHSRDVECARQTSRSALLHGRSAGQERQDCRSGRLPYWRLVKNGKIADPAAFRTGVFLEYHRRGNRLASVDVIRSIFERFGVSVEDFDSTWGSFEVAQKMRVAEDLARRWSVASVPAVVVNGKYLTGGGQAGSYPKLIELINELVERESVR